MIESEPSSRRVCDPAMAGEEKGRPGGPPRLALADDATGALETGARFAEAGLRVRVRFTADLTGEGALVLDTETRHLPEEQAYGKVREIALAARGRGIERIFKKTDSTLRGPIAAEFRALLEIFPERPLVYSPAYPALGRTVRRGKLYVEGVPLNETAFAADPLNPVRESSIPTLLSGCGAPVLAVRDALELRERLCEAGARILVCDGASDEELRAHIAAIGDRPCIVAGPAALAGFWAGGAGLPACVAFPHSPVSTCLVINGSLHPVSLEQLRSSAITAFPHPSSMAVETLAECLARAVRENRWAALGTAGPLVSEPLEVAARAAKIAAMAVRLARPDALVIFGGDTVLAVLRELGVTEAAPHREILPGTPVSTIHAGGARLLLVTKAGGFGGPEHLASIRGILEKA